MSASPSECVEHVWSMTGMTLDTDGTHVEYACTRCGAITLEGPDEVAGKV